MRTTAPGGALLAALLLASCSIQKDFSEAFLWPSAAEVAVPSDFGLEYEPVELQTGSDTSVSGWFIPSAEARGRTVLFSHANGINITFCHPYYRFLHDAGFNVFLYDYRGFGKSWGEVSIDSLLSDMRFVMDYLRSRSDVDAKKIALYGVSVGSLPTLRAAATFTGISGVVVEDVTDPQEFEVQQQREAGASAAGSEVGSYALGYFTIPWALDPKKSAERVEQPLLYLSGSNHKDLSLQFRIYEAAKGPKTFWVIPGASQAPTSLLVQDREYQAAVSAFLEQCFEEGGPEYATVTYRARQRGPQWIAQATVARRGTADDTPWPVEISFLHQGQITYHRVWLEGPEQTFEVTLGERPLGATVWRYRFAIGNPAEGTWQPDKTALAKASEVYSALMAYTSRWQESDASVDTAMEAINAIEGLEEQNPFSPTLEAELALLYWLVGKTLTDSEDEGEQELGRKWLERCLAAIPEVPKLHYWPDSEELVGFPHGPSAVQASLVLADFYEQQGQAADAVRVLEAATRAAPEDRMVKQKLDELR